MTVENPDRLNSPASASGSGIELIVKPDGVWLVRDGETLFRPLEHRSVASPLEALPAIDDLMVQFRQFAGKAVDCLVFESPNADQPAPVEIAYAHWLGDACQAKSVHWVSSDGARATLPKLSDVGVSRWTWLFSWGRTVSIRISRGNVRLVLQKRSRDVITADVAIPVHSRFVVSDIEALAAALKEGLKPLPATQFESRN